MGKKVKKGRGAPKEKRTASHSINVVPQQHIPSVEAVDVVSAVKEKRSCPHVEKGFDLSKLSEKLGSAEPVRCEDCRESAADRRGGKGKGKHGKKKGSGSVGSNSESKAIWVCLDCGHYSCGGVGFPTTPQSHAVRHAKQMHHPIAIKLENPNLRWCFPCSTLIPVEKTEENGENKDLFSDVVKLIKGRKSESSAVDAEEVGFVGGTGSVTSEIKSAGALSGGLLGKGGYVVRGLVNLGNTCFFNSTMQNLLALEMLRDYFFDLDPNFGSLTISLKKVFAETKPEAGLKNVINPRSFFGCVCTKAPQFRGYQQQDAHELLRCLLDSLSTEELGAKKRIRCSQDNENSSNQGRSFVDEVFGGKISSTVCCLECGHSSTVYEPFLDLSLPVPTKKPPSKKAQPVFRGKKPKLPPKRNVRTRQKVNKDTHSFPSQGVSSTSAISESSSVVESSYPRAAASDYTLLEAYGPTQIDDVSSSVAQNFPVMESEKAQVLDNMAEPTSAMSDSFSWMDYLEPEQPISHEHELTSENNDGVVSQDCGVVNNTSNVLLENSSQSDSQACSLNINPNLEPNSSVNSLEDELPLLVKDSEVLLLPYKEEIPATAEIAGEEAVASSAVGCEREELDFDGIGDLFNEPDVVVAGPMPRPSLGDDFLQSNDVETGFMALSISESDPDEVDDSDSPVSVESCLAHFIKPECLSNENAWLCENCSKNLRRQRLEAKKKAECPTSAVTNGVGIESETNPQTQSLSNEISNPVVVQNLSNGDVKASIAFNSTGESSVSDNGKVDCLDKNCTIAETGKSSDELNSVLPPQEENGELTGTHQEPSHSSDSNKPIPSPQVSDSLDVPCVSGNHTDGANHHDSKSMTMESESDEVEGDEVDSKSVKVMRDATKRVLVYKAPRILTIHLKRFSQDARGRLSKLNGYVKFGEALDLKQYMDPRCKDEEKYTYSLTGVVEHSGNMRSGHYVAYVRGGEKNKGKAETDNSGGSVWYHASDAYVRQVSLEEVLRCEAYILFYERN